MMKRCINGKLKQWLWFVGLWCGGFLSMLLLSYAIKYLLKLP